MVAMQVDGMIHYKGKFVMRRIALISATSTIAVFTTGFLSLAASDAICDFVSNIIIAIYVLFII